MVLASLRLAALLLLMTSQLLSASRGAAPDNSVIRVLRNGWTEHSLAGGSYFYHAPTRFGRRTLPASARPDIPEVVAWHEYKAIYDKSYVHADEESERRAAFDVNVDFIHRCNAESDAGLVAFRCGVSPFTDHTADEFRTKYLGQNDRLKQGWKGPTRRVEGLRLRGEDPPASVDWKAAGAVTPVKNQGSCGSCWSFATTGSLEGHYQIATGELRSLSEQQLIDCSKSYGNDGCGGGSMVNAFRYILANGGLDSEEDYPYTGEDVAACWKAAAQRTVATLGNFTTIPENDEQGLVAAVALGPVAVAIEADQPAFQHYRSGVFDNATGCGNALNHGVLVVGYDAASYTVKNSWGSDWGESGYIRMARGVNICGIAQMASYPDVSKGSAVPVPPPTPGPRPDLPCNCTESCAHTCSQFGMRCCSGTGGNCECQPPDSCPECNPNPPDGPYSRCAQPSDCEQGSECANIKGVDGMICMPKCSGAYSAGACPLPSDKENTTARPFCDACIPNTTPSACVLVCNATAATAECPQGATCKALTADQDPCDDGSKWPAQAHPCQATKTCGICTY